LPNGPISLFDNGLNKVSVNVSDKTRLLDKSDTPVENFSVADLFVGGWAELDGFEDGSGNVTALQVERFTPDSSEQEVSVEGIVDDTDDTNEILTILGITFDASGVGIEDSGSGTTTCDVIDSGDVVEVEWTDMTPEDTDPSTDRPQLVEEVELGEDG